MDHAGPATAALEGLDSTWRWLESTGDPAVELLLRRAGLAVPWGVGKAAASSALVSHPAVVGAFSSQRDDGSWGDAVTASARVLPTLWVVKALVGAGLEGSGPQGVQPIAAAVEFFAHHATTEAGTFTISGAVKDVLPCYVGLAATLFRDAGRPDLVGPQLDWLTRYQQVAVAGKSLRDTENWGHRLDRRYGGCFAATSCLIGVARAAEAWSRGDGTEERDAYEVASESILMRDVAFTRDGTRLLDLPAPSKKEGMWTLPAYPSDWRVDLVDVLHAVARGTREPHLRAARAVELLMANRRADGSWARGWHVTSPYLKGFGASPRGQGNPIATARAYVALTLLMRGGSAGSP